MPKEPKWTLRELSFIKRNYPIFGGKFCSIKLGRTIHAVRNRANKLKVMGLHGPRFKNRIGEKHGNLLVLKPSNRKTKCGGKIWICKCKCGSFTEIAGNTLSSKKRYTNTLSCGNCFYGKSKNPRITIYNRFWERHLLATKDRGLKSFLTIDQAIKIASNPCTYCGHMEFRKTPQGKRTRLNSLDRKNNEKYYKLSNTQSCCFICQRNKGPMTHKDFLKWCLKVATYSGNMEKIIRVSNE